MLTKTIETYIKSFQGLSREVWLLAAVTLINRSGMMVLPFLTLYTTQELGFTKIEAGLAGSAFGVGSLCGSWLGGKLADVIGEFKTQFWSLFLSGFGFFFLLTVRDFYPFCFAIFLASFIADIYRPAMMSSVGSYSKPENRARAMSLIRLAINIGFAGGAVAGGILAAKVGYHWLLVIEGATCIAAGIFFWFALPNHDSKTKEKKLLVNKALIKSPYKDGLYLLFLSFLLVNAIAFMQLFSTVPLFFKEEMGLNEDHIGILMFFNGFLLFAFEMPVVYILENRFNKLSMTALGTVIIAFSFLVFNIFGWTVFVAAISIFLITFGEMISFPFSNATVLDRADENSRGEYMGLYASTFSISFIFAPIIGTWLAENYGFDVLWAVTGGLSILAAFGIWQLKDKLKRKVIKKVEEQELSLVEH